MRNLLMFFTLNDKTRLILLSFLMLFVELTLIRWISANVYYLFYFSNFVLLACFLGIGIGFLRPKTSIPLFKFAPILLAAIIILCFHFAYQYHANLDVSTDNLDYSGTFFKNNVYPIWITLPIIFLIVIALMASIADEVARVFQKFVPLQAYRLEVIGSLLGIIVFSLFSFLHLTPITWGVAIFVVFICLLLNGWSWRNSGMILLQISMLAAMLAIFHKEVLTPNHFWSSYYKIEVQEYLGKRYVVNVNGLAQQVIESVEQRKKVKPFYLLPYQHSIHINLDNVLVIGAGTGGDVAIALSQGAKHVDAVEIDPMLYKLGKKFNPNHPYHDPRVRVIINDGRAFLQKSNNQYDMIIFAITDSLMLIQGQSSMRLENYMYTLEGLTAASKHLKPNGVFTIYNYYANLPWLVDRLGNTLSIIYKHAPCLDNFSQKDIWATVLAITPNSSALQCPNLWKSTSSKYQTPSTDDHPFMYLQESNIPQVYFWTLAFIVLMGIFSIKLSKVTISSITNYLDLFFMGAAFLLLETKSIINFALFFGTTWFVNALVFMGILSTVYLSLEITNRIQFKHRWMLYSGLLGSLLLAWWVPNAYLLVLPNLLRFVVATALAFTPIFIANLIFADRFRNSKNSTDAFGANLIGAVLGGVLEYASLIIGYHNLLGLIIILYVMAIVTNLLQRQFFESQLIQ